VSVCMWLKDATNSSLQNCWVGDWWSEDISLGCAVCVCVCVRVAVVQGGCHKLQPSGFRSGELGD